MDFIKVSKVDHVRLLHQGQPIVGSLHVTPFHLIFKYLQNQAHSENGAPDSQEHVQTPPDAIKEVWITYSNLWQVERKSLGTSAGLDSTSRASSELSLNTIPEVGGRSTRKQQALAVRIRCRDFTFVTFCFEKEKDAKDVYDSIKSLTCRDSVEKLYAFTYKPQKPERNFNGWGLYNVEREFKRQGVTTNWRLSQINSNYGLCSTYPQQLYVPKSISDTTLNHASKYRSKERIPVLTYIHKVNNCTLTRCSQPKPGVRGNRSIQDEKLVASIFSSHTQSGSTNPFVERSILSVDDEDNNIQDEEGTEKEPPRPKVYGAQQNNLIIDARPFANASAQQIIGAGSENMDHYNFAQKEYLGIDNIHVMRKSLEKVVEAIKDSDLTPFPANKEMLMKSNWLKHIASLLEGTYIITRRVGIEHSHVLIHCSDGWDRTSQLSALAQICLDPYYRTLDGFITLVEKDWVSFGYRFLDRGGYLSSAKWFSQPSEPGVNTGANAVEQALGAAKMFFGSSGFGRSSSKENDEDEVEGESPKRKAKHDVTDLSETSPVFLQFLDGIYQLMVQHPTRFEYNERFLRRVLYHIYSCQYGNFLYNNERDRQIANLQQRTNSVWGFFLSKRKEWLNPNYDPDANTDEHGQNGRLIFPDSKNVKWWPEMLGRPDVELNGRKPTWEVKDEKQFPALPDQQETLRDGPTVVIEDDSGATSTEPGYVSPPGPGRDDSRSPIPFIQGPAVIGTEKAAELAEARKSTETLSTASATAPRPIPARPGFNSHAMEELLHSDKEISQSYSQSFDDVGFGAPPVPPKDHVLSLSFDNDQDTTSVSVPKNTDGQLENNFIVLPEDSDQDPLGGHTAIDLGPASFSTRTRGLGAGRTDAASRSRSRGDSSASTGTPIKAVVKRKSFEEMDMDDDSSRLG